MPDDQETAGPRKENSGQFKKGQSGNPLGRPKGSVSIVSLIREKLEEIPEGQKKRYADLLVDRIFIKALKEGDTATIRDIIDRIDGKPVQPTDLTSGGKAIAPVAEIIAAIESARE